jgi:hypothetical protein
MGGYYVQRSATGSHNWSIHTQGGGWCVNPQDCLNRAGTALGSSKTWTNGTVTCPQVGAPVCSADGGPNGMVSDSSTINPVLADWNKVFIGYCDGASYAGNVQDPVAVGSSTLYYRGIHILDAIYTELLGSQGLDKASTVVVKGCSAGGLAVYLHADYLADKIHAVNPAVTVVSSPGAGLFLDWPGFDGKYHYRANYQWVFANANITPQRPGSVSPLRGSSRSSARPCSFPTPWLTLGKLKMSCHCLAPPAHAGRRRLRWRRTSQPSACA